MKNAERLRMVLIGFLCLLPLTLFSGCTSLVKEVVSGLGSSSASPTSAKVESADPLEGYVFAYVDGLPGGYHVATIVQPASASTKNQAEILDMGGGGSEKRWAEVFTSHPADRSELAVGEVVLYQGSGFADPDKATLRATTWDAYYITDTSDLFKGEIMIGTKTVPIKHLRIPDTGIVVN